MMVEKVLMEEYGRWKGGRLAGGKVSGAGEKLEILTMK